MTQEHIQAYLEPCATPIQNLRHFQNSRHIKNHAKHLKAFCENF